MPGCTAVARLLSECTTLRKLDLAGNHIGCDGARALLPALNVRDRLIALCENLLNCVRINSSAEMRRCLWRRLTGRSQATSSLEWLTIRTHPLHIFELKGTGQPFARFWLVSRGRLLCRSRALHAGHSCATSFVAVRWARIGKRRMERRWLWLR